MTPLEHTRTLVAVVPFAQVNRFFKAGWRMAGKTNKHTQTLFKTFPTYEEARDAGYRLKVVYGIE